jgi:uncharacterized membrane protein YphA (DoxX/SURF4 family)
VGVLTRITAAIFIIEMIGATLVVWLSQGFIGGPLLKHEWDILKQEVFPREKYITQDHKDVPI